MTHSTPLFSVVTVCLNPVAKDFLTTADSVFQQRGASLEWVIKDGGSREGLPINSSTDPRVRIIQQEDSGIFDAMNQAVTHCRGDYVFFLNVGDVFCVPASLERMAAGIQQSSRPGVAYCFYEYVHPGTVIKYPARLRTGFLYRRSVCHQATFVRRECFERYGGFKRAFRVGADDELLTRLILKHRVPYQLCPVATARVAPWDFSAKPENLEEEKRTRDYIRQEYFTSGQRWFARFTYVATLPGLRSRWLALPKTSPGYRLYLAMSNFVNQHI